MKHYSNVIVTKLREYSRSYGATETVGYAYGIDTGKQWYFYSENGLHSRTMRKGTKVLIDVNGVAMSEEAFNERMKELSDQRDQRRIQVQHEQEQANKLAIELRDKRIEYIKGRVTREKAAEWVERFKEGNAKQRNRKWIGKAVQIGLDGSDSRLLRDVCKQIAVEHTRAYDTNPALVELFKRVISNATTQNT